MMTRGWPKKPLGGFCASPRLHQNIEHIPVPVHSPPQPHFDAVDRDDDFIKEPLICRSRPVPLDTTCEIRAKPVHPFTHGFPADDYASLRQKILDISRAQRKPMIGPNGVGDNLTRKTLAFQARHLSSYVHGDPLNSIGAIRKLAIPPQRADPGQRGNCLPDLRRARSISLSSG